jgi:DnaJ-class molecular chaperone
MTDDPTDTVAARMAAAKRFECHWCKGTGREIQSSTVSAKPVISVHLHTYCRACRGVGYMTPARLAKITAEANPCRD